MPRQPAHSDLRPTMLETARRGATRHYASLQPVSLQVACVAPDGFAMVTTYSDPAEAPLAEQDARERAAAYQRRMGGRR